jgi:hypothetical protein
MRVIERPEIKGGNVACIDCGQSTRSHRLENPEYEEYEEVWEEDGEEYQGRKKPTEDGLSEEEVVIRYRLLTEQICMCHGCWTTKRTKAVAFLQKNKGSWVKDAPIYMVRIKKFLTSWSYYDFGAEQDVLGDITAVRTALKGKGLSEEE